MAKTLLGYKDVMSLGINKVMAYRMIHMVQDSDEYKNSNVSKVICGAKQVPISMFTNVFPEFKKACKAVSYTHLDVYKRQGLEGS